MAIYYWVGGSGTWNNVSNANWASSSGGAGAAGVPNSADTVNFDANSGTAAVVTVAATAACLNCVINKADINLSLSGSCTSSGTVTLTAGTITLNSYSWTSLFFSSNNSNARTIDFGTGKFVVTGNNTVVWQVTTTTNLTVLGTPVADFTYSGGTGTRGIRHGFTGGTETNSLSINVTAGTDIIDYYPAFKNVNFTGFSGSVVGNGRTIYGNLTLSPTMTITATAFSIVFGATSGAQLITTNGVTLDQPITFNGAGGTFRFEDNFVMGASRVMTLTNGILNANDKNVTVGTFATGPGTKTLTLGSGTWTVAGASWNIQTNVANLTVSASTGTISMTSASAKTFSGGAKTWPTLNQGGAGALTIQQSNTFTDITDTVQPATITLTSGTTQTVTQFTASGTAGNLITLNASTPGSRATLTDSGGVNSVSYMDIKDIAATGYGEWQAYTSNGNVDSGNNVGWVFTAPPPLTASEYQISLKSFTERRSF